MNYNDIDVDQLVAISKKAGEAILKVYTQDFTIETKDDRSPLTEADKRANAIIIEALKTAYPDVPYISEETKLTPYDERKNWKRFWLIDPLDGTKEFIKKNGEFTVNIALIEDGVPVVGVVYIPVQGKTYAGIKGFGSFVFEPGVPTPRSIRNDAVYTTKKRVTVVASRSHLSDETMAFVDNLRSAGKEVEFISSGSSLKFCLVAEGKADVYPRFGPTMEWDTAAAHAVALYAGKNVINVETKQPLQYNKEDLLNPYFIVE
jgi:3'(2'), 5'-bisphosphate nucleotidase